MFWFITCVRIWLSNYLDGWTHLANFINSINIILKLWHVICFLTCVLYEQLLNYKKKLFVLQKYRTNHIKSLKACIKYLEFFTQYSIFEVLIKIISPRVDEHRIIKHFQGRCRRLWFAPMCGCEKSLEGFIHIPIYFPPTLNVKRYLHFY